MVEHGAGIWYRASSNDGDPDRSLARWFESLHYLPDSACLGIFTFSELVPGPFVQQTHELLRDESHFQQIHSLINPILKYLFLN